MKLSDTFVKIVGIVLIIFGLGVLLTTKFAALDIAFGLHFVGGLLLIGAGIVILRGGNITL